jgi:hypothetical protein
MSKYWVTEAAMVFIDYQVEADSEAEARKVIEDAAEDSATLSRLEEDRRYVEREVQDNVELVEEQR